MNKYIKTLALCSVLGLATSCNLESGFGSYISQDRHNEMVGDEETKATLAKAALQGTYSLLQEYYGNTENSGLKAFHLFTDLMCEDVTFTNDTWFMYDYQLDNSEANYSRTYYMWRLFYKVVSNVNLYAETYYGNLSQQDEAYILGTAEAFALRGIAFYHLVNMYQHTYVGHKDSLGIPIILTTSPDEKPARATVEATYNQIIRDLTPMATRGQDTDRKIDVDRSVAAAYLAKVYAQMEDWANCEKFAAIAKGGGSDVVSTPGRPWSVNGTPDVLWGADVTPTNSALWASYWSHIDQFMIRGYAAGGHKKGIFNHLYDSIPATDSRRKLWVDTTAYPEIAQNIKAHALNKEVEMEDYDQMKFIAGEDGMEQDLCYIRVQDPILLEIEAQIEQNKLNEAVANLTEFVQKRDPAFVPGNTQEKLREQVRFQRRIELWCEGTNWFDMKRWKLKINRNTPNSNHNAKFEIATDDPKFYHMIPISEIESNPNLKQNTR